MFKILYRMFLGLFAVIALLLVFSIFPITGNYKIKIVQSGSMEPVIHTGSVVVSKPFNEYKINDVITFNNSGTNQTPTTHRIIEKKNINGNISYITKGDANDSKDRKEVLHKKVIGKVLFTIPYLGFLIDFVKKPFGFFLIIVIPALLVAGDEFKKIFLELKKIREKKNI